jgi:hypothetical protein
MLPPCGLGEAWRCCLSRQDTSGPDILFEQARHSSVHPWPASGGEALEVPEGSTPPPGPPGVGAVEGRCVREDLGHRRLPDQEAHQSRR